jgi:sarcosine oxidase subunit alpha
MTGSTAVSQNRWPSLAFDVGAVNDIGSPLFSAGFYYKTFMWPKAAWKHVYEPFIRNAAGLGVAPEEPDPDHYASRFAHCDVLVIGGGVAGLRRRWRQPNPVLRSSSATSGPNSAARYGSRRRQRLDG